MKQTFHFTAGHPLLDGHRVQGTAVLPGLSFIDMVLQFLNGHGIDPRGVSLRNLAFYRPLSVEGDQSLAVELTAEPKGAGWSIRVQDSGGQPYVGLEAVPDDPSLTDGHLHVSERGQGTDIESIYERCRRSGLVHAGVLKATGSFAQDENGLLAEIHLPTTATDQASAFIFHPTLLDAASLATGMAFANMVGGGEALFMPLSLGAFRWLRPLGASCFAQVMRGAARRKGAMLVRDVVLYDAERIKVAEITDFACALVREPANEVVVSSQVALERHAALNGWLAAALAAKLGIDPALIEAEAGFYELGLDSAGMLAVAAEAGQRLKLSLPPTLLFEHTRLGALAAHLESAYPDAVAAAFAPAPPAPLGSTLGSTTKAAPHPETATAEPIAIIGMAGRYPGARDLDSFWRNLCNGVDSVTEIPLERWDHRRFDGLRSRTGRPLSRWGGFIDGHDSFDARFFRISPREAEMMDPQERQFMEVCWEALEDAGHTPETVAPLTGSAQLRRVGVFAGVMHKDYTLVVADASGPDGNLSLSLNMAQVANRVSFFCNFHGPSVAVDTVCSSSLVAVHMAVESLRRGETDACLAGGVNLSLHPAKYQTYGQGNLFSTDGRCRAFGKGGDGYVPAEGVGAVVLKTLSRALADGDPIHAVIRGSAVNHVGHVSGFTVPSPVAQAELVRQAQDQAGIAADSIGCIEAHGTGTSLGDPIEIEGLTKAFRSQTAEEQFCAIGSVKSNIGHAEAAAGISGLTKLALQIREATLVPSLHAVETNPHIDFAHSPFIVQRERSAWPKRFVPRRGAVSSFGATGTNAHVVLEEAPARATTPRARGPFWLPLSTQSAEQLPAYAARLAAFLRAKPETPVSDLAYTFQTGRKQMASRAVFLANDASQLASALEAYAHTGMLPPVDTTIPGGVQANAWCRGEAFDWTSLYHGSSMPRRIHAPTYPFVRERHWVQAPARTAPAVAAPEKVEPERDEQSRGEQPALLAVPRWNTAHTAGPERIAVRIVVVPARSGGFPSWLGAGDQVIAPLDVRNDASFVDIASALFSLIKRQGVASSFWQVAVQDAEGTALAGLTRSAALEGLGADVQIVQASAASFRSRSALQDVLAQAARTGKPLLRERDGQLQSVIWEERAQVLPLVPWKDGGVYLVTGGAGGLGRLWAGEILRRCPRARVVLTGRSHSAPPAVAGPGLSYRQADVTNAHAVADLVAGIIKEHGRLDGIIHSAGILSDGMIRGKDEARFRSVLVPKVDGAMLLDEATKHCDLDVFLLFSSGAGAFGNRGQADYATANAWLGCFAQQREALVRKGERHGRTLAVHWPLWDEGGMRPSDAVVAQWRRDIGLAPLQTLAGFAALYQALGHAEAEVVVLSGEHDRLRSFFKIISQGASAGQTIAAPHTATIDAAHAPAPDHGLRRAVLARLKQVLSEVTKLPADAIGTSDALAEFGVDSVMAVEFGQHLSSLSPEISHAIFYESSDLGAMADALIARHGAACRHWTGHAASTDVTTPRPEAFVQPDRADAPVPRVVHSAAEPIAIIGMAGRYPDAPDLAAFWANLASGHDAISEIPEERWPLDGFFEPDRRAAVQSGKSYGKWGGFLGGFADFDPLFFQISPMEAAAMDPQERLFVETAWHVFEDAGYSRDEIQRQYQGRVGVFAGITRTGFNLGAPDRWRAGDVMLPATSFASVANRVSYLMNLNGPSMPVDTMCSSSLTAVHEACEKLRLGACDMALAGGVNLLLHPLNYINASAQQMLSPDGQCKSFGAGANGYVPGEGVGAVLLKRLSDAERDGDMIHAVILASAVNHNGRTNGYTVPNPRAQRDLIRQALAAAAVDPSTITYIEAHGTGTELGDPIEIEALKEALSQGRSPGSAPCAVASVKSSIGHLEAAAGLAGLTKAVLQMRHRSIAPSLHAATPNPKIDLAAAGVCVPQQLVAWEPVDAAGRPMPRRAGISSFGAGGANAHVILEEYVSPIAAPPAMERPVLVVLSARTQTALRKKAEDLLHYLEHNQADLSALAFTLQTGREAFAERLAIIVNSVPELVEYLRAVMKDAQLPAGACRGRAGDGSRLVAGLADDEGMAELVAGWARQGNLARIATLWVEGYPVDWRSIHSGHSLRRISLPGYPFERQTFWTKPVLSAGEPENPPVHAPAPAQTSDLLFKPVWRRLLDPHADAAPAPAETQFAGEVILHHPASSDLAAWLAKGRQGVACFEMPSQSAQAVAMLVSLRAPCRLWLLAPPPGVAGSAIETTCLNLLAAAKRSGLDMAKVDVRFLTRGAFDGQAEGAGLSGLCHGLQQSGIKAVCLDLDEAELQDEARRAGVLALIRGAPVMPRGDTLRVRLGALWQRRLARLQQAPSQAGALKTGGRYAIIGGAGLVGRLITRKLIETHRAEVVWIGRTAPDDEGLRARLESFSSTGLMPSYHQADARDTASLTAVANRLPPLSGVIFAAMDFAFGGPLDIEEQAFTRVFETKRSGALSVDAAFRNHDLDFICHFSSIQAFAFADSANSTAYGAGICAADAVVRQAMGNASRPTGIINWGFWRPAIAGTILERNSGALDEGEALACFESALALICSRRATEVVCMRPPRAFDGALVLPDELVAPRNEAAVDGFAVLQRPAVRPEVQLDSVAQQAFLQHATAILLVSLRAMKCLGDDAATLSRMAERAGIQPGFSRWLAEAVRVLVAAGLAEATAEGYRLSPAGRKTDPERVSAQWRTAREDAGRDPKLTAMVALLSRCMDHLPEILRGTVRATDQVFPKGKVEALGSVYEGNDWSDFFNDRLAACVVDLAMDIRRKEPGRTLRFVEIGAGTGSTSRSVLAALGAQSIDAHYLYTDVSPAFAEHGRTSFGSGRPWMEFAVWNVDAPAPPPTVALSSYDIVIATNVLHATPDIRRALRNAKAALRPGGVLLLNETVWKTLFGTLTFGLLDGWWAFADAELRLPGAPLLSPDQWLSVLAEEGFAPAVLVTEPVASAAQCVIAARSDGWRIAHSAAPERPQTPVQAPLPTLRQQPSVQASAPQASAPNDSTKMREVVASCLAQALNIPAGQMDGRVPFSDYGVDSIVGTQVVTLIGKRLGVTLNASVLYEHTTLDALSRHLASSVPLHPRDEREETAVALHPRQEHEENDMEQLPEIDRLRQLEEAFLAGTLSAADVLEEFA